MEKLEIGLILMVVGMVTVFIVLLIIINLCKGLIALVNKYAPEEDVKPKKAAPVKAAIAPEIMQVIQQTVNVVTGGKGTVANVEKI